MSELLTADGEMFDPEATYHYFDETKAKVLSTDGLKLYDGHLCDRIGSFAMRIVPLNKLRRSRDKALRDGQIYTLDQIERLRRTWKDLEKEKAPKRTSVKYELEVRV